jgi:hypothetical protein
LEPRPSPPGSEAQEVGYREPGAIVHRGGGIDDCGLELGVHGKCDRELRVQEGH